MFTFFFKNDEPFGPLTKNCPRLDKNKSIVSIFSVFVVYKPAVVYRSKKQLCRMFQFSSVNACICTSISWYFNKIDQIAFSELEKDFLQQFRSFFCEMTAEVLRNNCAKRHKD